MLYTNDETDRHVRGRNYYLTVFGLPVLVFLAAVGALYCAYTCQMISQLDLTYGCVVALTPTSILYLFQKRKWLKMPDDSYHFIAGEKSAPMVLPEGLAIEATYRNSRLKYAFQMMMGMIVVAAGIVLLRKLQMSILIPLGTALFGVVIGVRGLSAFLDREPQLVIATNGLWTKTLGFVRFENLDSAAVVQDNSSRSPQYILELRLKDSLYSAAGQPDERLVVTNLEYRDDIDLVLTNALFHFREGSQGHVVQPH